MDIGRDGLIFSALGVFADLLVHIAGFISKELEINLVSQFFQPLLYGGVGFDKVFVAVCLECCLEGGVGIAVVCNHYVLVATV